MQRALQVLGVSSTASRGGYPPKHELAAIPPRVLDQCRFVAAFLIKKEGWGRVMVTTSGHVCWNVCFVLEWRFLRPLELALMHSVS